jgi:peroxiredoxin/glutamine cyclotransferase
MRHIGRWSAISAILLLSVAQYQGAQQAGSDPRTYENPLVQLQRLDGRNTHLHVDEVRLRADGLLLQCSYTFGVVDATSAENLRYLSQNLRHTIPGDTRAPGCIHLAWDNNIVYTTHRGNIRNPAFLSGWDITNRESPKQLPVLQEPGVSYEGVDVANGIIFVGLHEKGLGAYRRDAANNIKRVGTTSGFLNAWGVAARGNTVFVADGIGGLVTVDAKDPTKPRVLGRVEFGGQARGVVVDGDVAYVASGSAGLVLVNVANLSKPSVIAKTEMPGTAMRVDYSAGRVFVAAWNDVRVYDVTRPESPRFIGAARVTRDLNDEQQEVTSRILGVAARGNDVFVGNWHVLHSFRLYPDRRAPSMRLSEAARLLDFGVVESGNTRTIPLKVMNQGTAPLNLRNISMSGSAFRVAARETIIPAGSSTELSLTYAPSRPGPEDAYLQIESDDPAMSSRRVLVVANRPGLGIGSMLPETTGTLLDGTPWSSNQAKGKVLLLTYFATFCPVCGGQLPDLEARFWQKYKDRGLVMVSLNAHDAEERVGEVLQYADNIRVTFPLGLEKTRTYAALTQNFVGFNPFPVDVVVGKDGRIAHIAREYDPDALVEVIDKLLAK